MGHSSFFEGCGIKRSEGMEGRESGSLDYDHHQHSAELLNFQ